MVIAIGNYSFSRVSLSSGYWKGSRSQTHFLFFPHLYAAPAAKYLQSRRQLSLSCKLHTAISLWWYKRQKADWLSPLKNPFRLRSDIKRNFLHLNADKRRGVISVLIFIEQNLSAHYPLMSSLTGCVLVHNSVTDAGEWAFSVRTLIEWPSSERYTSSSW